MIRPAQTSAHQYAKPAILKLSNQQLPISKPAYILSKVGLYFLKIVPLQDSFLYFLLNRFLPSLWNKVRGQLRQWLHFYQVYGEQAQSSPTTFSFVNDVSDKAPPFSRKSRHQAN